MDSPENKSGHVKQSIATRVVDRANINGNRAAKVFIFASFSD
jgi:hypothetical protein